MSPDNHYITEGGNAVNRQPSNGLKFNRQASLKRLYFAVNRHKCRFIFNRHDHKVLRYLKFHYFSWSSRTSGSWRISKLENSVPMLSKTTLSWHYKTVQLADIWKYFEILNRSAKTTSKTQKLILSYTEIHICFNSWAKFLLNNRQPSKLEKLTVNSQSYHPTEALVKGVTCLSELPWTSQHFLHFFTIKAWRTVNIGASLYISAKLPTYPFPKPTLALTSHLAQNVGLKEG